MAYESRTEVKEDEWLLKSSFMHIDDYTKWKYALRKEGIEYDIKVRWNWPKWEEGLILKDPSLDDMIKIAEAIGLDGTLHIDTKNKTIMPC